MLRMWKKNRVLIRGIRMQRTIAEQKKQLEKYKSVCNKIREYLYQPLIEKNEILQKRQHKEADSRDREEYQRDYTRILYSSAFRRLQGKMQLMAMNDNNFIRNRLTHSLEVAQIARSIANDIGYSAKDIYVVEACSLAHDIGNPPFGHNGERVLNDIIKSKCHNNCEELIAVEGFEGNAQTLRVLTNLSGKSNKFNGLNLTNRVLLGVTKYFHRFYENGKCNEKYIYKSDFDRLEKIVKDNQLPKRTLDVQIMDLSDEIAYAAHDIEDTLKNRQFTIEEFMEEFDNNPKLKEKFTWTTLEEASNFIKQEIIEEARDKVKGSAIQYNDLFAKEVGSLIIFNLIRNIDIVQNEDGSKKIDLPGKYKAVAEGLKTVTFECINRGNEVKYYEAKGKIILEDLFRYFYKNTNFLPKEFQNLIHDENNRSQKIRVVVDYISGMMDGYAVSLHKEIYGNNRFKVYGYVENKYGNQNEDE